MIIKKKDNNVFNNGLLIREYADMEFAVCRSNFMTYLRGNEMLGMDMPIKASATPLSITSLHIDTVNLNF